LHFGALVVMQDVFDHEEPLLGDPVDDFARVLGLPHRGADVPIRTHQHGADDQHHDRRHDHHRMLLGPDVHMEGVQ